MNKVKLNYWLDVVIGVAFVLAAMTGIAFLFLGSGGYQGGRNAAFQTAWLGISREVWSDLHTLGGLVMTVGVGVHLALHWNWMVCMTRRMLPEFKRRQPEQCQIQA